MIKSFLLAAGLYLCVIAQAQRSIAVLGSSTAAGNGATQGHGWVALTSQYLKSLGLIDTIYNLAVSGYTTWDILPTGYPHPAGSDPSQPGTNITKALSFLPLPKIVVVSMPSNDLVNGWTMAQYMGNLHTIYDAVTAAGVACFVTTTQPRDDINTALRNLQKAAADSIEVGFPGHSLDFWDTLADHFSSPDSLGIKVQYQYGDGIHINDAGHMALFQIVKADLDLLIPLPLSLSGFNVSSGPGASATLRWTASDIDGPVDFYIQRSADGIHFDDIGDVKAGTGRTSGSLAASPQQYSWIDPGMPPGRSFYRLRVSETTRISYSPVLSCSRSAKSLSLTKLYLQGSSSLVAEISTGNDRTLQLVIVNSAGLVVGRQTVSVQAPDGRISIPLQTLAAGQYYLQIKDARGQGETRAFSKF